MISRLMTMHVAVDAVPVGVAVAVVVVVAVVVAVLGLLVAVAVVVPVDGAIGGMRVGLAAGMGDAMVPGPVWSVVRRVALDELGSRGAVACPVGWLLALDGRILLRLWCCGGCRPISAVGAPCGAVITRPVRMAAVLVMVPIAVTAGWARMRPMSQLPPAASGTHAATSRRCRLPPSSGGSGCLLASSQTRR